MRKITVWQRFHEKKQQFIHNHIEDGHCKTYNPVPLSDDQIKSWKDAQWNKRWTYLIDNVVQ
jgi:hypothetical protein